MSIRKITLSNFRSFNRSSVELGAFNVLVGPNASGKSNFTEAFKFLRDIANHGLENAISMQGGVGYLRNIHLGSSEPLSIEVVSDTTFTRPIRRRAEQQIRMKVYETTYNLSLRFNSRGEGFRVEQDKATLKAEFETVGQRPIEKGKPGRAEIILSNVNRSVDVKMHSISGALPPEEDVVSRFRGERLERKEVLPEFMLYGMAPRLQETFESTSVYNFDPHGSKRSSQITGKADLEEDGSNLAIVLKGLISSKQERRKFLNLIQDLLPFVERVDVEKFADKSLLLTMGETYYRKANLPASLISDGTINIACLIVALYFQRNPFFAIEEPERCIHPGLMARLVNMMRDASQRRQILVTTHNPELVKHTGLENLLFISRDVDGYSNISRPVGRKAVKTFLSNKMGIDELYVQDLLGLEV